MTDTAALPSTARHHLAVIPCRWGSTRFPGKPLAPLAGKPLLWHVHQRCQQAQSIDDIVVATDDRRIAEACRSLGIKFVMTGDHPTGTDRVAECASLLPATAYINVQGDEPFIDPAAIDAVSRALINPAPGTAAVNACTLIDDAATITDHNVVKVVLDADDHALMFSRHAIPYPRGTRPVYRRQLGLYGFTPSGLALFGALPQGPVELAESVEMLRLVEHGHQVRILQATDAGLAVDTPEDLARAESSFTSRRPPGAMGREGPLTSAY